jgi:hypothetical protein
MVKTHREELFERLGKPMDWSPSLQELADATGVPKAALQTIHNRGVGAWKTNPQSVRLAGSFKKDPTAPRTARLGKEQWGRARIYSFLNRGKAFYTADKDIATKYNLT